MMWKTLQVLVVWCLVGVFADPDQRVMGGLKWCSTSTMCMCEVTTNDTVRCFNPTQIFELVAIPAWRRDRLLSIGWDLNEKVEWCSELCLCHRESKKNFRCTQEENLTTFILDTIGDAYFLDIEEEEVESEVVDLPVVEEQQPVMDLPVVEEQEPVVTEEESEEPEHSKRSERRRNRNGRRRGRNRWREDEEEEVSESPSVMVAGVGFVPQDIPEATTTATTTTTTTTTESPPVYPTEDEDEVETVISDETLLPRQEAVAASPAVTALQPPTRRQPFPTTAEPYTPRASSRDVNVPRIQPVLEVPKEKKTVASQVSQDLDELGGTIQEIKGDVVLNQRILLVTVAIAGVAMLGVIALAIHGCASRRQQAYDPSKKSGGGKDENHVTKLNMEEAW